MRGPQTYLIALFLTASFFSCSEALAQDIVGGKYVEEGTYPFMVGLVESQEDNLLSAISCGATLIDEMWVLSAGHCVADLSADDLEVLVGTYDLQKPNQGYERVKIKAIYLHPGYKRIPFQTPDGQTRTIPGNDIALLRLEKPIDLPNVQLPMFNDDSWEIEGLDVKVMGWGRDDPNRPTRSSKLKEAEIQLISKETCKGYEYYDILITDNMICAGLTAPGQAPKGGAAGDSGGPLIVATNEGWTQLGIMSWGISYTTYQKPGVYQKVYKHLAWLREVMASTSDETLHQLESRAWRHGSRVIIENEISDNFEIRVFGLDGQLIDYQKAWLGTRHELFLPEGLRNQKILLHLSTPDGSVSFVL